MSKKGGRSVSPLNPPPTLGDEACWTPWLGNLAKATLAPLQPPPRRLGAAYCRLRRLIFPIFQFFRKELTTQNRLLPLKPVDPNPINPLNTTNRSIAFTWSRDFASKNQWGELRPKHLCICYFLGVLCTVLYDFAWLCFKSIF